MPTPTQMQMSSRVIERLDAEIARAEGVLEREYLKARRAAALARHGQFAEARFALAGLRSQGTRLRDAALLAWIALVDGLIDHCESLAPAARDKFSRARELAIEAPNPAVQAEASAWLSVSDLNANDLAATVTHAAEAVRLAPRDAHAALARAALVIGDAWRFAGEDAMAQRWYQRVRQSAAAEGDISMVSMLLHNMAAFRAYRISLDDAFGHGDKAEAQRVLMEAESTGNYDAGVGNAQLVAQVPLLRAQLMTVLGRYDEAISLIDGQLPRARTEGQAHREARYLADAAHGEAQLGRLDEAARRIRVILAALPLMSEVDDLAATHARVAGVMQALGRAEQAAAHRQSAEQALAAHEAEQKRWRDALGGAGLADA
jgi:tetratricopeptide (TPR) repeat protein